MRVQNEIPVGCMKKHFASDLKFMGGNALFHYLASPVSKFTQIPSLMQGEESIEMKVTKTLARACH
jgi:hypothetical protein